MQKNNTGRNVSWKWLLYEKVKNVFIIYSRVLNFSEVNFCVDIFLWPKFSLTLRGHVPVNFQYFQSNSLHFMHLFKPFIGFMQFAWTFLSKFAKSWKLIPNWFSLPKVVSTFFYSHKQLLRMKKTRLIRILWQSLQEKVIKSQMKSTTKR